MKAPPMPNNQDAVKTLTLPDGYYIETMNVGSMGGFNVEFFDANGGCFATGEMAEPEAFAEAMNAPTPREQELESQNKALIAGLARIMAKDAYQDYPEGPIKHGPLGTEALETLAAIQKAKEAR